MPDELTMVRVCAHMGAAFFVIFWAALRSPAVDAALRGDRLWFRAKRFGWGWTPATWEGWLVVAFYALWMVLPTMILAKLSRETAPAIGPWWLLHVAVMTAALVGVCARTGERPRWRWGR